MALLALLELTACEPNLSAGKWTCSEDGSPSVVPASDAGVDGWKTGFESRFCDYAPPGGSCYPNGDASFELATSPDPVHHGHFSAAFRVVTAKDVETQTRCIRQGTLPRAAFYGAWYYLPAIAKKKKDGDNWNLFHFRGGKDFDIRNQQGKLDVSLDTDNGGLQLAVFGNDHVRLSDTAPDVPIGKWFHIALYMKRGPDKTGEVGLYLDGNQIFDVTNVATDDSPLGQWFVGNLANELTPPDYTVYVDDLTISDQLIYEK